MYFDFKNIRGLRLSSIIAIFRFNKIIAKQIFFILLLIGTSLNLSAQKKGKDFSKIMQSTSIYEIDAYLRIAHPDDPKRSILKPRLIKMLKEYIRTAHPADNDPNSKESIVLIENKSDCNMIVRIEGVGRSMYRLPVASKTENSIVVAKGNYLFSSNVCGAEYASQKSVHKAIMVSLNNPGK